MEKNDRILDGFSKLEKSENINFENFEVELHQKK